MSFWESLASRPIQSFEYEDVLPKLGEFMTE